MGFNFPYWAPLSNYVQIHPEFFKDTGSGFDGKIMIQSLCFGFLPVLNILLIINSNCRRRLHKFMRLNISLVLHKSPMVLICPLSMVLYHSNSAESASCNTRTVIDITKKLNSDFRGGCGSTSCMHPLMGIRRRLFSARE